MHLLSLKNAFRARLPPNLPCGNDPTVANHNGGPIRGGSEEDPTTPETVSHPSHRRGRSSRFGDRLCMEKHRVSCICYLSKTHFVRDFLQIYHAGTILQLQITMEYRFENDPRRIRPHPRPSRTRRTAEVDHRGSGIDFVWKNIGFRASAISQKRISARLPPNLPCGNDPTVANHNGGPIRGGSEEDPTTPETVSHPSHRRGRSSRFGDRLCMEKHKVSCICYLSKTHFVRDFLQIYHAGTILQLQITMEDRFEEDPRRIRPHPRPSRTRRTAEVDHRGSGTDFVWKNIGFRASAISQKRISCETSSKFTMRERSYSCKSQWNTDSKMIRGGSEKDPLSLTNSFFDWLFLWLTLSLTNSFFDSFFDWLFLWLTLSLTDSFPD